MTTRRVRRIRRNPHAQSDERRSAETPDAPNPRTVVGAGSTLGPHAVVGAGARLGAGSILSAGAFVAPGAAAGARTRLGPAACEKNLQGKPTRPNGSRFMPYFLKIVGLLQLKFLPSNFLIVFM